MRLNITRIPDVLARTRILSNTVKLQMENSAINAPDAGRPACWSISYNAYSADIDSKIILFTKEGLGIRSTSRILKISPITLLNRILKIAE